LPAGAVPASCLRLFWSWPKPVAVDDEEDARRAVAVILTEGVAEDWRQLDLGALADIVDELPLFGGSLRVWKLVCEEAALTEDRRDLVLGAKHRRILGVAGRVLAPRNFEFAGGSALAAAYLGHRRSDDLDFFSLGTPIGGLPEEFAEECAGAGLRVERRPDDDGPTFSRMLVEGVKVEIAADSAFQLAPSDRAMEGMPVRSLKDLAADKTLALFGRATTRDFVDVYVLRSEYGLDALMEAAKTKDPGFSRSWFAKALQQAEKADPKDVSMLVPLDFDHMKADFAADAARLIRADMGFRPKM